jgi:hypothetical protein
MGITEPQGLGSDEEENQLTATDPSWLGLIDDVISQSGSMPLGTMWNASLTNPRQEVKKNSR